MKWIANLMSTLDPNWRKRPVASAIAFTFIALCVSAVAIDQVGRVIRPSASSSPQVAAAPQASGSRSAPSTTAPVQFLGGIGQTLRSGNWDYKIVDAWRRWSLGSGRSLMRPVGQWIMMPITLTNRGSRNFGIGFQDFELVDECGVRYSPDTSSQVLAQYGDEYRVLLSLDQFPPGVEFKSMLLFDVNPQRQTFNLRLQQTGDIVAIGRVRLAQSPGTPARTFQPAPCG